MFPAVVIDLGTQVAPAEAAWVVEACNAAVVAGTCELDTTASEPARALAIVRWTSSERSSVRIEVGLREAERAAWSVRELSFSPADPARERWRSVGLVLATLVGEVEAARNPSQDGTAPGAPASPRPAAPSGGPAPAAPQPGAAKAATEPATKPPASAPPAPSAGSSEPEPEPEETASVSRRVRSAPELPVLRPTVFIAAGALAGPGVDFDDPRWGGGLRGGWISATGWVLSGGADYSHSELQQSALAADWFRVAAGAGHRWWWSERWSLELGLELGARALRAVPKAAGSIRNTAWSPQAALHGEVWWQAGSAAGAWLGLSASSIGRETRLLGSDGEPEASVPAIELHGMLGFWWAP